MSTINYPRIARKKLVTEKYTPNTFRVISTDAEGQYQNSSAKFSITERLPDLPVEKNPWPRDTRYNNPHPFHCEFLRSNVRFINEPICTVHTLPVRHEQDSWWPSRTSSEPLKQPPYTLDTTFRQDFRHDPESPNKGFKRHDSNPNTKSALGVVPVNFLREKDGSIRVHKEGISYEHMYNCRNDPNYPVRAKRHGSFVWHKLMQDKANQYINQENARRPVYETKSAPVKHSVNTPLNSGILEAKSFTTVPAVSE